MRNQFYDIFRSEIAKPRALTQNEIDMIGVDTSMFHLDPLKLNHTFDKDQYVKFDMDTNYHDPNDVFEQYLPYQRRNDIGFNVGSDQIGDYYNIPDAPRSNYDLTNGKDWYADLGEYMDYKIIANNIVDEAESEKLLEYDNETQSLLNAKVGYHKSLNDFMKKVREEHKDASENFIQEKTADSKEYKGYTENEWKLNENREKLARGELVPPTDAQDRLKRIRKGFKTSVKKGLKIDPVIVNNEEDAPMVVNNEDNLDSSISNDESSASADPNRLSNNEVKEAVDRQQIELDSYASVRLGFEKVLQVMAGGEIEGVLTKYYAKFENWGIDENNFVQSETNPKKFVLWTTVMKDRTEPKMIDRVRKAIARRLVENGASYYKVDGIKIDRNAVMEFD
jgi:hypothetical protein